MSVFLLFNKFGQTAPSAIQIADIAHIGQAPDKDPAILNRAFLRRYGSADPICISMTFHEMHRFSDAVNRAVSERSSKGYSREGFITLDERYGPHDESRLIVTPTRYFNLITPANADGSGSTIEFVAGHVLPEKSPVMDRTSLSVVNTTSEVIREMTLQGHRFIDLKNVADKVAPHDVPSPLGHRFTNLKNGLGA